jgi:hypothetical protein
MERQHPYIIHVFLPTPVSAVPLLFNYAFSINKVYLIASHNEWVNAPRRRQPDHQRLFRRRPGTIVRLTTVLVQLCKVNEVLGPVPHMRDSPN